MTDPSVQPEILKQNREFQLMPEAIQTWILASPNATRDFHDFFAKNGTINPQKGVELPYYSAWDPPRIVVDSAGWDILTQRGAARYPQFEMFGILAHEIGHDRYNTGTVPFTGRTADEYVQYRAGLEGQAIFNAYPIFKDLEQHPDFKEQRPFNSIGYLQGIELAQMYKQWRKGELDEGTIVDRISAKVPDRPYTLGAMQDQNGDGQLTHRDAYLRDYNQYIAPKLEPQAPGNEPIGPADPKHPDHAMLEQIRAGVRKVDQQVGKSYDDASERISRCLLAACKDNREMYPNASNLSLAANALNRVDHVLMGTTGNIFAIEGRPDDPANKRAVVPVETAVRTPVEQSDEKLQAANQSIAQERALVQQQELTRGINDPSQSGPKLAM